ncbi:MAG: penicillin-binding protein 2 [Clostridia bacterium]|nr:penicillin-binding protein 2 [Clostridia bacterium]
MAKRLITLIFLFSFLFIGLTGKAFYEQIIMGPSHVKRSLSIRTIDFPGEEFIRGDILDRNGISLTDTAIRPTLVVYPRLIENPQEIATKIKDIKIKDIEPYYRNNVKIYPSPFFIHINENNINYLSIVKEINSPGLTILPIKTRYGPNALAEHIIGYIGYPPNGSQQKGLKGIEGIFDEELRGSTPEKIITPILDARNNVLSGLGYRSINLAKDLSRSDIYLTIDSRIQKISEDVFDSQGIIQGGVVVLDIETGNILAAVSRPSFDQNNPNKNMLGYNNQLERVIDYRVYPGSIYKVITAAAALEAGIVTPETKFYCEGFSEDFHVTCPRPHGELTFTDAMARSCNVTFVKVGLELGREKLEEYMIEKFGFTPVKNKALDSKSARANGIIGQEIFATSPLEIANMMATIARGGYHQKIVNPWQTRLVQAIGSRENVDLITEVPQFELIYNQETAQSLQNMLTATNQWGSGSRAWIEGYGSAGKTGTPQSSVPHEYYAWYAGYAPIDSPKYAIAVLVEEKAYLSKSNLQGGAIAGPIFKEIMESILKNFY